jgi:hypothetical protein
MISCPICGEHEFEADDDLGICPVCDWQNDGLQYDDPTYWGGANDLCLNDYKAAWEKRKQSN